MAICPQERGRHSFHTLILSYQSLGQSVTKLKLLLRKINPINVLYDLVMAKCTVTYFQYEGLTNIHSTLHMCGH